MMILYYMMSMLISPVRSKCISVLRWLELEGLSDGKINCIASQTKAYLAANGQEFCYFLKLLWELNPEMEVITEDDNYHINTIKNPAKQALKKCQMILSGWIIKRIRTEEENNGEDKMPPRGRK